MNVITKSDVDKFLTLLKAGMKHGRKKELKHYTNGSAYDGTDVVKEYYVSIEFAFHIDREIMDEYFADEDFDVSKKVDELLK